MDRSLIFAAFASVFLAELGDKTQLATLALSASQSGWGPKLSVFLGASLALVASSAIGVLLGDLLGRYIDPRWIKGAAGAVFVVLGGFYLKEALT